MGELVLQEAAYEANGLRPVAKECDSAAHDQVQGNLRVALMTRLRGGPCRAFGPNMRVPTVAGRHRLPDALVSCTPVDADDREVPSPVIIFEILSEKTLATAWGKKLQEYQAIPSLIRYVMLDQSAAEAVVITRAPEFWQIDALRSGDVLAMPEIGIEVPIDELYTDVAPLAGDGA